MSAEIRPLVYLAGPIDGCTYGESTNWRDGVITELIHYNIAGVSPMRSKEYLADVPRIVGSYEDTVLSSAKGITTRDRWDCQRADVVLVNFIGSKKVSVGTIMELGWADAARRPLVVAMEPGNFHDHPMVREVAGFIVPDLDAAVNVVKALLLVP